MEKLATELEQRVCSTPEASQSVSESFLLYPAEVYDFLNSSDEIQPLKKSAHKTKFTFPEESSRVVRSQASEGSSILSDIPHKFQLTLVRNPNSGDIIQTIYCKDQIFRTQFTISKVFKNRIQNVVSTSPEEVGIPTIPNLDLMMEANLRTSLLAVSRLTVATCWITKSWRKMYEISNEFTKSKYSVKATGHRKLHRLAIRLQKLNVFAGIIYQISLEMLSACKSLQSGILNSKHVHAMLKMQPFRSDNKHLQTSFGPQLPICEAMLMLTDGIKGIDSAYKMGEFSLQSLECGVKSKRRYKKLIRNYLEGVKVLGTDKDIEYGSLLMTSLCSSEMIWFYKDAMPVTDVFLRSSISKQLENINSGTYELIAAVKKMETESYLLSVQTMGQIQDVRDRQNKQDRTSGVCACTKKQD